MADWFVGLPTRASAERAAKWGGIACLFQGARETLGNLATSYFANKPIDDAVVWFVGASLAPIFVADDCVVACKDCGHETGTISDLKNWVAEEF
jgi:hypothetical protein